MSSFKRRRSQHNSIESSISKCSNSLIDSVIPGDCVEELKKLPDNSVDLIVTSPPFGKVRLYDGFSFRFKETAVELARVLKHGGILVWEVGDTRESKSYCLTPERQVVFFADDCGLRVHQKLIYERSSSHPARHDGKLYSATYEYCYVLSKGEPSHVNIIKDKRNRWAGVPPFGNPTIRDVYGELVHITPKITPEKSPRGDIWYLPPSKDKSWKNPIVKNHPARMSVHLAFDLIRSYSNPGDIVLDPFAGSGTSLIMAKTLGRHYIGIECSKNYCDIIHERLNEQHDVDKLAEECAKLYNSSLPQKDEKSRKRKSA